MNKENELQKEKYTFNDFIKMIEKTENKEEKRLYISMINTMLETEQMQNLNKV